MRILVADDEERMRRLVADFLENEGYEVVESADGNEAVRTFLNDPSIDLVILDIMMPGMDGYEVLRNIRQKSSVPVIMLTAKSGEKDELKGFELGVDEYVTKPFSPKVLVKRVEALLRRTALAKSDDVLEEGGITVDISAHSVNVDGRSIELSVKEFELLVYFMKNKGIALSRERILNSVWDYDYFGDDRTIDTHVKKLRAKIGPKGDLIKTVWGLGYKFES